MNVMFESKGNFDNLDSWLKSISKRNHSTVLNNIAKDGERNLASNTPKDTGKTASGWTSEITTKGDISEISWLNKAHPGLTVNVAKIIDQGHGTGTGGYPPPPLDIPDPLHPTWKTAADTIAKELVK